jgi:3',5'-cyclic AMP phosphodiesterase CpdA
MSLDKIRIDEKIDGIILSGDFAYDFDSNNGKNYEEFLAILSRIGKFIPVFLQTGNH